MAGDTTNRLAGTAYVTVNGVTVMVEGSFKYQAATVNRTTLTGMDGVHGYKEKPVAPYISARLRDSGGTNVQGFNQQTNVNVIWLTGKLSLAVHSGRSTSRKWKAKMQYLMFAGKAAT